MIASAFLAPVGVLLACASRAVALGRISIPSTVKADTEVEVKISNDLGSSNSFDADFTTYNLYLATTPPGWGTGPVCLLANNTKIDVTSVKVKIPADAVPNGADLMISTQAFSNESSTGFGYSNGFTFSGGNADWSKTELNGEGIGDIQSLPCSALGCARKCNDKYYDERHKTGADQDINSMKNTYECVAACPGATFPAWQSLVDEYNNRGGGSNSTASPSASGTAASGASASATASTSPTGSSSSRPTSASTNSSPTPTPNSAVYVGSGRTPVVVLAGLVAVYGLF